MIYFLLKTLHILGVTVWLGGMAAILIFYTSLAKKNDREGLRRMLDLGAQFGQKVIGPSVGVALLAAIAMILMYDIGMPLWIWLGIALMVLSMGLGGAVIRKRTIRLTALLDAGDDYRAELAGLMNVAWLNLLILAVAVAVMVIKPV